MAKLTLADGTIFEGTTEEIFAITERFNGAKSDEPVAESLTYNGVDYKKVDRKAQEGDVIILRDTDGDLFKVGKVYEVLEDVQLADSDGDLFDLYRPTMRRTTETVLVYAPKVEPLEVGDYAVVINRSKTESFVLHSFDIGEVVRITTSRTDGVLRGEKLSGKDYDFMNAKDLRKATDEEVAEAKALVEQSAKEAVFTQAGRKPNEYRKGDIIRYENDEDNRVYEVAYVIANAVYFFDKTFGNNTEFMDLDAIIPIAFVESRLDRN